MIDSLRTVIAAIALAATLGSTPATAVTLPVISMSDGGNAAVDIRFDSTSLSTNGPQSIELNFSGFLESMADLPAASFVLKDLMRSGSALQSDMLMMQRFTGGTSEIHLPNNTLLLSGNLSTSILHGTVGAADGMLFTTTFSEITGGILKPRFSQDSLVLQMHLWDVNGGAGISTLPSAPPPRVTLQQFSALATVDILGEPIPEPAAAAMWIVGCGMAILIGRRCRGTHAAGDSK